MLPELEVFESFLAGAAVVRDKPTSEHYEHLLSSAPSALGKGITLWISYKSGPLKLDSILKKIAEGLSEADGVSGREVALAALALVLETKGETDHVRHANRLLKEFRPARVSLNFVSPAPHVPSDIDIRADYGVARVEPFDASRLQYWARKGGSSWPIDIGALRGRPAIRIPEFDVSLINVDRLPGLDRLLSKWEGTSNQLVDAYYQAVVDVTADRIGSTIRRRLSLAEAAGIAGLDKSLATRWLLGVHLVTWSSSGAGSSGCWALLRQPGFTFNWPEGGAWRRAQKWLYDEFGVDDLSGIDERPLGAIAQTFAGLIQDARTHQAAGRVRESFLYFVIALDHLLGEDGRNSSTVADRTSVLTHRIRSKTFEEEVSCIRRVYDIRSRFVHSGVPVSLEHLLEADEITRCVLCAITHVVVDQEAESRDTWVAKIDALAHILRGDPSLASEDRFAAVGARANFRAGTAPPLLRYGAVGYNGTPSAFS